MKTKLLTILLFAFAILSGVEKGFSQTFTWWAKAMGGTSSNHGNSIALDASGNVYTTGYFLGTTDFDPGAGTFNLTTAGSTDIFISKLDANGNFVWAKSMGGTSEDIGYSIALDASGNVYTTGYFEGTADFDPGSGQNNLTSAGGKDIFISKLDASGNFVWAKQMGGTSEEYGYSITLDASGNVYTTGFFMGTADFDPGSGTFNLTAGYMDTFISKLDASGNFVWAKKMGGINGDVGCSIAIDNSGNVYTMGRFDGTADFDPGTGTFNLTSTGSVDIFISKLNANGNFVWAKSMGSTNYDYGNSIALDASGNVYTTGNFAGTADFDPGIGTFNLTSAGGSDIFISKLDASGNFVWAKSMGGDYGNSIALDASGNVFTTGYFYGTADFDPGIGTFNLTSAGGSDIFISKLDASGNFVWAKSMEGTSDEFSSSIALDALCNVYTTGYFYGTVDFDPGAGTFNLTATGGADIFICKWSQFPIITIQPANQTTCETTNVVFVIAVFGSAPLPLHYQWQHNGINIPGSDNDTLFINSAILTDTGNYNCIVWNNYGSDTSNYSNLIVNALPTVTAGPDQAVCTGTAVILSGSGATSYIWDNGVTNGVSFTPAVGSVTYTVTGTDVNGCSNTDQMDVVVGNVFQNEQICLVTVDTVTWKNKVMWEKTAGVGTGYYIIYKETGVNIYAQIGNTTFSQPSEFIDIFSVPESHGDKYKISVLDTCGNESNMSFYHKTMNLTIAAFGNTMGLNWDDYIDESGNYVPFRYYIYRGTSPTTMALHDSVSGSFNSYNDINVFNVYYYIIGVKKNPPCNVIGSIYSYSNRKDNSSLVGINSTGILTGTILIAPNPMTNTATMTIPNFNTMTTEPLQILDITGKIVKIINISNVKFDNNKAEIVIERGNLKPGVYFVELKADRTYRGKLIIE